MFDIDGYAPDADTEICNVQDPLRLGATTYPEEMRQPPFVIAYCTRPPDNVVMNLDVKIFLFLRIVSRKMLIPGTTYDVRTEGTPSPTRFVAVTVNRYFFPFFNFFTSHKFSVVVHDRALPATLTL